MAAIAFDALKFTRRLRDAGVPEAQAEAQALRDVLGEALDDTLATRSDIARLESQLSGAKTELRQEMSEMKFDLLKWVIGIALAQTGLLVGVMAKWL